MTSIELKKFRHKQGLCYDCNNIPLKGKSRCKVHINKNLEYVTKYFIINKLNEKRREKRELYKNQALDKYGRSCSCCGESHEEFLQIDHIDGSGAKHRRECSSAKDIINWLKRNNWPLGFRTLCSNCNWAMRFGGVCPHVRGT